MTYFLQLEPYLQAGVAHIFYYAFSSIGHPPDHPPPVQIKRRQHVATHPPSEWDVRIADASVCQRRVTSYIEIVAPGKDVKLHHG